VLELSWQLKRLHVYKKAMAGHLWQLGKKMANDSYVKACPDLNKAAPENQDEVLWSFYCRRQYHIKTDELKSLFAL
jgi:hypothetical protein